MRCLGVVSWGGRGVVLGLTRAPQVLTKPPFSNRASPHLRPGPYKNAIFRARVAQVLVKSSFSNYRRDGVAVVLGWSWGGLGAVLGWSWDGIGLSGAIWGCLGLSGAVWVVWGGPVTEAMRKTFGAVFRMTPNVFRMASQMSSAWPPKCLPHGPKCLPHGQKCLPHGPLTSAWPPRVFRMAPNVFRMASQMSSAWRKKGLNPKP